jgi:Helix-turn-helix domain
VDEARLRQLVGEGWTLSEIARALGRDRSTVRRHLRRLGLQTERMRVLATARSARTAGIDRLPGRCPRHGEVEMQRDARGTYRCVRCRAERVAARRRRIKEILVAEAGGSCRTCGYDRCLAALEFHHVDPAAKSFALAYRGLARSLERARQEARKCVLLCSNCHAEVEAGARALS